MLGVEQGRTRLGKPVGTAEKPGEARWADPAGQEEGVGWREET